MQKKHTGIKPSPWLVVWPAIILLIIVITLAIQNINREERYMSRILSEKGASLIKSFEAGARTGMMSGIGGGKQFQRLLEETARQPDILYLILTDQEGNILAHNDRSKIGKTLAEDFPSEELDPENKIQWRLAKHVNRQPVFEVYRYFQPLGGMGYRSRSYGMSSERGMGRGNDWSTQPNIEKSDQIIFVGLDITPFENARKEDIKNSIIISGVLVILGLGGLISLFWAQSYRSAKRSLQDTSAFADQVVTNLPVGLIATDREDRITFINNTAEKITGFKLEKERGKDSNKVLPPGLCGLKEYLAQGKTILEHEMECAFSDQTSVPLSLSATSIINEEGNLVGNVLLMRDLAEVRRLQEEIRRKEKLAALGSLAAGVAHEIRNPLSSIKGLASYFGSKFAEGSDDRQTAGVMVREVDRLDRVISELLYFARPSELNLKLTDINDVLEHTVRLAQQDAKTKNIEIEWSENRNLPRVLLDPDRFSQCLLNLYLNAIQAMDEGGVLSVKSLLSFNEDIKIEIADTGKGMNPDEIKKIFDPYFTTKSSGTGLGLAIVHKIIEAHQGRIDVKSTPGKGTVFSVFIPLKPGQ
ncbi:ATP-binding protein [Thermodesulfobacteriota bacterium]